MRKNESDYYLSAKANWLILFDNFDDKINGTQSWWCKKLNAEKNKGNFNKFFHDMINNNILIEIPEKEININGISSKFYKINFNELNKFRLKLQWFNQILVIINREHKNNNALGNDIDVWNLDMNELEEKYGHT